MGCNNYRSSAFGKTNNRIYKGRTIKNRSSKDENSLLDRFLILWNPNEDVFLTFLGVSASIYLIIQ